MENLAADFIINFNNPIEAEFELSEGGYDCSFELFASGTVWGSISGTLSNQTDLQAALDLKADKTELNTAIQNEAATRAENDTLLQNNINTLSQTVTANYNTLDGKIDTEISDRTASDTTLQNNINAEALTRQNADTTLQGNIDTLSDTVSSNYTTLNTKIDNTKNALDSDISDLSDTVTNNYNSLDARITTNTGNIATNAGNITTINSKIPNQASSSNQLADKSFVNSSIATNTANFIGTFNSVAELEAYTGTLTNNDYAFVATTDAAGNTLYDRYKYNADTQEWLFEYELNNSSFTAQQWASINSGATSTNIGQITTNANNIADLQTNKQDVLTAGANIQINNNVISATDTTYTAGTGISIVNGVISNTQTSAEWGNIQGTLSNQTDLQNALDDKYDASNPDGFISGITSSDVTTALGYTPYNSSNPDGYITSADLPTNHVTTNTAQTISADKTFTGVTKFQNGSGNGCVILGADVASTTVSTNTRKLGRMSFHTYTNTLDCAFVSTDADDTYNQVEFGGRKGDITNTSPDILRFTVANSHNSTTLKTHALEISYSGGANFTVLPKYNNKNLATEAWVSNQGFTKNIGTVTSVNNIQPDANGNVTLTIPDTSNLANKDLSNLSSTGNSKFQEPLVSGTNIKTINNNSILGSGNLTLDGLPSQTGQSGKFLTTDGTNASWQTVTIPTPTYDSVNERITW